MAFCNSINFLKGENDGYLEENVDETRKKGL